MAEWFVIAPKEEEIEKRKGRGPGHWGHKGRPGKVGGSLPAERAAAIGRAATVSPPIVSPKKPVKWTKAGIAQLPRTEQKILRNLRAVGGGGKPTHAARWRLIRKGLAKVTGERGGKWLATKGLPLTPSERIRMESGRRAYPKATSIWILTDEAAKAL